MITKKSIDYPLGN